MAIQQRGNGLQVSVQVTVNGDKRRYRQVVHCSMQEAEAYEARVKADLLEGREPAKWVPNRPQRAVSGITLENALEMTWEKFWMNGSQARTIRSNMKTACEFFGADTLIGKIGNNEAEAFMDWLGAQNYSVSTIRGKASTMTKCLKLMKRRGHIQEVPYFELPKPVDNTRDRYLTDEEFDELVRLFSEDYDEARRRRSDGMSGADFEDLFVILMDTGARPSELRNAEARLIRDGLWTLKKTKTTVPRTLPLTQRAQDAFDRQVLRHGDHPFAWATSDCIRHGWDWARTCMNLSEDTGFIPYALRHTCATRLYAKTRDLMLVKKWMGHKDINMTLRYAKLQPYDLERARDLLEQGEGLNVVPMEHQAA